MFSGANPLSLSLSLEIDRSIDRSNLFLSLALFCANFGEIEVRLLLLSEGGREGERRWECRRSEMKKEGE